MTLFEEMCKKARPRAALKHNYVQHKGLPLRPLTLRGRFTEVALTAVLVKRADEGNGPIVWF